MTLEQIEEYGVFPDVDALASEGGAYVVIVEPGERGWGAYAPDLPGLAIAADTEEEVRALIPEAVALHLEGLRAQGELVPAARTGAVRVGG